VLYALHFLLSTLYFIREGESTMELQYSYRTHHALPVGVLLYYPDTPCSTRCMHMPWFTAARYFILYTLGYRREIPEMQGGTVLTTRCMAATTPCFILCTLYFIYGRHHLLLHGGCLILYALCSMLYTAAGRLAPPLPRSRYHSQCSASPARRLAISWQAPRDLLAISSRCRVPRAALRVCTSRR